MKIHEGLRESIENNRPQEALYHTGELAKLGEVEALETTWYVLLAQLGKMSHFSYKKWMDIGKELLSLIQEESFHMSEAFILTYKLCLIYRDCSRYYTLPKYTVANLRTKVIPHFKDDIRLSEKGLQSFQAFLPKDPQEREFCIKILSGLIALWTDRKSTEVRWCLEYLDRKHFDIQIPSDLHLKWNETHYSFHIFLWECLGTLETSFDIAKQLYQTYYTRKYHGSVHVNFLYGLHTVLQDVYNEDWNSKDMETMEQLRTMSEELSKQIKIEEPEPTIQESSEFIFERFFPTVQETLTESSWIPLNNTPVFTKTIHLHRKRGEKKYKENKDTSITRLPYE